MYSRKYGYIGKPDHIFGDILADIKTSAIHSPLTSIQTAAYAQLVAESTEPKIKRRIEVLLLPTGKYSVREFKDQKGDFRLFLCSMSLYQFMSKNYPGGK
jgi:uncharacterized protein (DUF2141 family)